MAGLDMNLIMSPEETEDLFSVTPSEDIEETQVTPPDENGDPNENQTTEEDDIDKENLFVGAPESVGRKSSKQEKLDEENTTPPEDADISPNTNYSSYANAFKVDGIFQNLSDEDIEGITDAESFLDAMDKEVAARFDEQQRRVLDALNAKVEPSAIRSYENTLKYLDGLSDAAIAEESNNGEKLRADLIYQDYINRGLSKERAEKMVKRSFDSGSDIEDAKEALLSNKQYFNDKYKELIKNAQAEEAKEKERAKKENENLKNSILTQEKVYGDFELDKATRQKIYDNICRPAYKDPETGEFYTAIQKYEMENRSEFLKNVGLFYTLTNGFKDMDALVKGKVKKGVRRGLKELERVLTTQPKPNEGNIRYMGGTPSTTVDSLLNGKLMLDI